MKKPLIGALALCAALLFAAPPALAADPPDTSVQIQVAGADAGALPGNPAEAISAFREPSGRYYDKLGFSTNHYAYTNEELIMLARVIHNEVRGEPYAAMLAVGNVVMNRVLSPGYPGDTIREVVTRPNQFAYSVVTPLPVCLRAARDVLDNEVWVLPQDVYFFRAVESRSDWGRHRYYKHIGATAFYRENYAGRSRNGLVPPALHKRAYEWPQYGCEPGLRVAKVQQMLCALGYAADTDGRFDAGTRAVLTRFQRNEGLTPDGVADPATLSALIRKCRGKSLLLS
jgi:hypothetical protein